MSNYKKIGKLSAKRIMLKNELVIVKDQMTERMWEVAKEASAKDKYAALTTNLEIAAVDDETVRQLSTLHTSIRLEIAELDASLAKLIAKQEEVKLGALERIATALETLAKNQGAAAIRVVSTQEKEPATVGDWPRTVHPYGSPYIYTESTTKPDSTDAS